MAIYGMNFPTASGSFGGLANWTNLSNAYSDADGDAAASWSPFSNGDSSTYYYRYFGFAIASGTITGVKITIRRKAGATSNIKETAFQLKTVGGAVYTADLSDHSWWATSYEEIVLGGPGDTLGVSWTLSNVNDATTGLQVEVTTQNVLAGSADIEFIGITIYTDGSTDVPPLPCGGMGQQVIRNRGSLSMWDLRQSTASQEIPLGPFVDSTDGDTNKTGLTIANTDIKLWKTGATTAVSKNSGGATHDADGVYYAVLDATDTNTIGPLAVNVHVAGALAVTLYCRVLDEAIYDQLYGTSAIGGTDVSSDVAAIKAKTDNLPSDPADASDIASSFSTVNGKLDAIDDYVDTEIAAIKAKTDQLTFTTPNVVDAAATVSGTVDANLVEIGGETARLTAFGRATDAITIGTVDTGSTTTSVVTSSLTPTATVLNQFKGQVMCFAGDTTTTNLRGVKAVITASDSSGVLEVSPALPAIPASGDTFTLQ